MKTTQQ